MATAEDNKVVVEKEEVDKEEVEKKIKDVQSHYLRCPSPSRLSTTSDRFSTMTDRFSLISGFSTSESIFMEPIHLSSAIAAKKIINEEFPKKDVTITPVPESMLETAEQLMVEDLYNRVKDMIDDQSPYNTPCVLDIQRALIKDHLEAPLNPVDEVWQNIFIGEKSVAVNKSRLKRMGITHILNAAHGTGVYTGQVFYADMNITYMGIEVDDFPEADISPHLRSAAEFLDEALLTHRGKVLVDSMMGVSRSAVLVAAYLMIFQDMTIMDALLELRKKRAINPNEGFLKQLRQLNENLLEERDNDENETLSQCSIIDNRHHLVEEESLLGVKAHSIMMEEEGDCSSVMSSVLSSAEALSAPGILAGYSGGEGSTLENPLLPSKEKYKEEESDEDGIDSMIREWQRRNEKYQNEDWWEAQLMCENEDYELSTLEKFAPRPKDLESVTSEDVKAVKETLKRCSHIQASDTISTISSNSYSDVWKDHLREIEEQAKYCTDAIGVGGEKGSDRTEVEKFAKGKQIDDELESLMSDSGSLYNFCRKNRDNLSPLERWRIKRIQYGWNKKEGNSNTESIVNTVQSEEGNQEGTSSLEDVSLTAYQTWKLRNQKKHGGEENKEELLEICCGPNSSTVKRRQRREELLERSRKTLEESQSVCGFDSTSSSSIPFSAFCAGAFPAPSTVTTDETTSILSGGSLYSTSEISGRSSFHSHSQSSLPSKISTPFVCPPSLHTQDGEPMINLDGIRDWISNVVVETLVHKQGHTTPTSNSNSFSTAGSVYSLGTGELWPNSGKGISDDDKLSLLSGATSSCSKSSQRSTVSKERSDSSHYGSIHKQNRITTTSVPLYSLFQDEVNLGKLNSMGEEIKIGIRDKMATYEKKKIAEDNKRSTLYKKKKSKDGHDVDGIGDGAGACFTTACVIPRKQNMICEKTTHSSEKSKHERDFGLSGRLNISGIKTDKFASIDEWLRNVRPPKAKSEVNINEMDSTVENNTDQVNPTLITSMSGERFNASSGYYSDEEKYPNSESASADFRGGSQHGSLEKSRKYSSEFSTRGKNEEYMCIDLSERGLTEDEDLDAYIKQIKQKCRDRVQKELAESLD